MFLTFLHPVFPWESTDSIPNFLIVMVIGLVLYILARIAFPSKDR